MFCFCQNKRIPALCLILLGLGIILLIPKLATANNQSGLYSIDTQANAEFYCDDCYSLSDAETIPAIISQAVRTFDVCDICHTDNVESLPEDVAYANAVEVKLFDASVQAVKVQQDNQSARQQITIETAVDLLAQAQVLLDTGEVEQAETLIEQVNNLLADVGDEQHLASAFSPLFRAVGLTNSTTGKNCQGALAENSLAGLFLNAGEQAWALNSLESHLFNQVSAEAMHRRAPPADEDALMLTTIINLLT